jgi:hypothetical protein
MNTNAIAKELRLSHWAGIMRERTESGLSIKAFCENAGFHENIYFYWQRKLREVACTSLLDAQPGKTQVCSDTATFKEVRLAPQKLPPPPEKPVSGEVRIEAAGMMIAADSDYPPANLAELIRGLIQLC